MHAGLNSPNYSLRARLRFTNFTEQTGLNEYNVFVDSMQIYVVMSWINFIFMFSSGLEIFSTHNINIHIQVYGYFIHVLLNWLCPLLLTISCHSLPACPVRPAAQRHLAEKKVSLYFKKNYLKKLPTILYWWCLLSLEPIVIL